MQAPSGLRQRHATGQQQRSGGRPRGAAMRTGAAARGAVRELQHAVATKQRSAADVARDYLERLRSVEGQVASFITVDEDATLAQVGGRGQGAAGRQARRLL
jgi:hypothetical protein